MCYYVGTTVAYVSPHHLLKVLRIIPQRKIFLARELTKLYEETLQGSPKELLNHFQKKKVQGEFVLIMPGSKNAFEPNPRILVEELQKTFNIDANLPGPLTPGYILDLWYPA